MICCLSPAFCRGIYSIFFHISIFVQYVLYSTLANFFLHSATQRNDNVAFEDVAQLLVAAQPPEHKLLLTHDGCFRATQHKLVIVKSCELGGGLQF